MKSKTDFPDRIIKLLIHNKTLRFTELKLMTGLSNPAISYHLKNLVDKKIIEFDKKGKEKYYKISEGILDQFESKLTLMSKNYTRYFISESDTFHPINQSILDEKNYEDGEDPFDDLIKYISETLSALFFYSMTESMVTGENWTKLYDVNDIREEVLLFFNNMLFSRDNKKTLDQLIYDSDLDGYFKKIEKLQGSNRIFNKLNLFYEKLKVNYLHQFEYLESKAQYQI